MMKWVCFFLILCHYGLASSKDKPHAHQGVLKPYDGKPLHVELAPGQVDLLDKGEPVMYNDRDGKIGRGMVIQDIGASPSVCMDKIRDLTAYHKMVPHVKKVEIYDSQTFNNGTTQCSAQFNTGMLGINIEYFLKLTHEPKYNTLTWTLDYSKTSDLDDSVGHWQVMPHPSKSGWTRLVYSTQVKLFPWIPEFVVNTLTSKALTEATSWVKRESTQETCKDGAEPQKEMLGSKLSKLMGFKW